jgi:hypothetical protein
MHSYVCASVIFIVKMLFVNKQDVTLKETGTSVKTNVAFVQYGVRQGKERSGAYLFLPDGEAKVC